MSNKLNYKATMSRKKIAFSIIGVISLLVLFLCIGVLRRVVYGVFGYAIYAYLPALLSVSIMLLLGKKPNVSLRSTVLYLSLFFMVVITLHTGLHKEIIEGTSYLNNTYASNTVGGVLIGLFVGLFRLICAGNYGIMLAVTFVITALLGLIAIYPLLIEKEKGKSKDKHVVPESSVATPRINNMHKNSEGEYVARIGADYPNEDKEIYDNVVNVSGMSGDLFSSLTSEQDKYRSRADKSADILFGNGNLHEEYNPSVTKIDRNKYSTLNTLGAERGLSDFELSQSRQREIEQALKPLSPQEEYDARYGSMLNPYDSPMREPNRNSDFVNDSRMPVSPYTQPMSINRPVDMEPVEPVKQTPVMDRVSAIDFINTPISGEELVNMDYSRPPKKENADYSYMYDSSYSAPKEVVNPIVNNASEPVEPIVEAKVVSSSISENPRDLNFEHEQHVLEVEPVRNYQPKIEENVKPVASAPREQARPQIAIQEKFNLPTKQPKPVYTSNVMAKEKAPVFPEEKKDAPKKPYVPKPYKVPSFDLLNTYAESTSDFPEDYNIVAEKLNQTMQEFDVPAEVFDAKRGPTFTMYYLKVGTGYKLSRIASIKENLKMRLCVKNLRIHAPIEGQDALGIELPNSKRDTVGLKSILCSPAFNKDSKGLKIAMGKTLEGEPYVADITKMPHMLVAGSTGTGKSVFLNAVLTSLIYKYSPDDLRMVLIDPKKVELTVYRHLPNLLIKEPVKEAKHAVNALRWLCEEMDRRYDFFSTVGCANIDQYNDIYRKPEDPKMYRILLVIDEMADLMINSKDSSVESYIVRIAQLARACGIHMIIATQRPTVKVITGLIKSNIIHRVAFTVKTNMDSRVILDDGGAEELLGLGDMLYSNSNGLVRMQGAFVDIGEIKAICDYIRENNESDFNDEIAKAVSYEPPKPETVEERSAQREEERDAEFEKQLQIILKSFIATGRASVSSAQASHHVGYIKARKLVDEMTNRGFLSPGEGAKPRDILITMEEWEELFGEKSVAQDFVNQDTIDDDEE
ncbi:MAG: hypothetical protein IKB56_03555 [Clostridia bacterium]|nr:hypothetical protein [Clostridia bacterium]